MLRTRLLARCAGLGLAGRLLFPAPALAESDVALGAGAYLSFSFGEKLGIGYGVEGFATYLTSGRSYCVDRPRAGLGPVIRAGMVNAGAPQLTLALMGGGQLDDDVGLIGELGGTLRFGERSGLGLHLSAGPQMGPLHPYVRGALGLGTYDLGVALRMSPFGPDPEVCVIGRPLRDASGAQARASLHAERGDEHRLHASLEAQAWAADAEEECASVLAFAELAEQLVVAGAPPALVIRALAAGEEEIGHAVACARIASAVAGTRLVPVAPDHAARRPVSGAEACMRLAVESWTDGCLGEGVAAELAARAAAASTRRGAALQRRIAAEERGHAELAWDVMAWAARAGGDDVRHALWQLRDRAPRLRDEDDAEMASTARATRDREAVRDAHVAASRARLTALLEA